MLTAALDGLIDRFGLEGEPLGEVAGGAVLKHSHDRDLARESVLSTRLAPETPAYDVQQACGTGLETTILVANKIALGQIDAGIACGADTTSDAPIALNEQLRETLLEANRQRSTAGKLRDADRASAPATSSPASPATRSRAPASRWASTARSWRPNGRSAGAEQDELAVASHQNLAAAYERGFLDDLLTPYLGLERDQNLRPDSEPREAGEAEAGLRRPRGDDDRGQLDPAQRRRLGGAARLRGVGEGARPAGPRLLQRGPDRGGRPRPQARRAADGARLRDAGDARPRRARPAATSTTTRSTRPSPPRSSAR